MSLAIATITNSITGLSITGLTIKDVDEIPQAVINRDCPLLVPDPANFVTGFEVVRDSLGAGSDCKYTAEYMLNYILLYAVVGAGRTTVLEKYSGMVSMAFAFYDAVLSSSSITGAVDFEPGAVNRFDIITWGGTDFHTCSVGLNVKEFVN